MKRLILIALVVSLAGCASFGKDEFLPSNVIDVLTTSGCQVKEYHHNQKRQQIDIECK